MKKSIKAILLAVISIVLLGTVVKAATWEFKFPIIITDTSNVTRTYYPVVLPTGSTLLSDYIITGLDTNMQSGTSDRKYMISTAKITTVVPNLPSGGHVTHNLYTGYSPAQTGFPIIIGDGGYVTTFDHASLEHGANFTDVFRGYVDTAIGTISVYASQANINHDYHLYNGAVTRAGERFTNFPANGIVTANFSLRKAGVPTGNFTVTARQVSDDKVLGGFANIQATTLTVAYVEYSFDGAVDNPTLQDIRIQIEYSGGGVGNDVQVAGQDGGSTYANGVYTSYNAGYTDDAAADASFTITNTSIHIANLINKPGAIQVFASPIVAGNITAIINASTQLSALGVSSSEITVQPHSDSVNSWLTVDTASAHYGSANVTAVAVPDNANDYIIGSTATPYMEYVSMTIGGNEQLWYQPNAIISGTTLPDRDSAVANDGTITWGTNQNISLSYGALESSGSTVASGTTIPGYIEPDFPMPNRWFGAYQLTDNQADSTFSGAFLYDVIHQQFIDGGLPTLTVYAIIFISLAGLVFLLVAIKSGSILAAVMAAILVLFGGSQTGTAGAIPLWLPTFGLITVLALIVTYRQMV